MPNLEYEEVGVTSYQYYFNIAERYKYLFDDTNHVWEALVRLPGFINQVKENKESEGSYIDPTAYIHPSAIITASYIGPRARIYEGVVVRNSVVGEQSVIGHGSEIARSLVLDNASIPRFDYLGASIVGNSVRLGGMVACASRRFDSKEVVIRIKGSTYRTEYKKFGSIIGDNSVLGFSVHCNPGTLIGPNSLISPQVEVRGFVPPNSLVVVYQRIKILPRNNLTDFAVTIEEAEV